jgi:hypothetical protein
MYLKKKDWSMADISSQIHALARECASTHNDGFTAFELKKELYLLKEIVDHAFEMAPDFGEIEQKWLTEQEKKRIIKILKS